MKKFAFPALLGVLALTACGSDPTAWQAKVNTAVLKAATMACALDGKIQPVAVTVAQTGTTLAATATLAVPGASVAVPLIEGAVAVDQNVVHPDVVKVCTALGGTAAPTP